MLSFDTFPFMKVEKPLAELPLRSRETVSLFDKFDVTALKAMKKIEHVKHCYLLQVILGQYLSVRTRFEA